MIAWLYLDDSNNLFPWHRADLPLAIDSVVLATVGEDALLTQPLHQFGYNPVRTKGLKPNLISHHQLQNFGHSLHGYRHDKTHLLFDSFALGKCLPMIHLVNVVRFKDHKEACYDYYDPSHHFNLHAESALFEDSGFVIKLEQWHPRKAR